MFGFVTVVIVMITTRLDLRRKKGRFAINTLAKLTITVFKASLVTELIVW